MAVEFLTDAQVAGHGRFDGVPSRSDLGRFFLLDDADKALIGDRRGDQNRLGFVLQATTVRYLGVFLEDPLGRAVTGGGAPGRAARDRRRIVRKAVHRPGEDGP